jgi:hypothetical protein
MPNVINPSPKTRFQENKNFVEQHRKLIERSDLQVSLDYAMLEYQKQLVATGSLGGNEAAASHFRMLGAHEFVQVFKLLAEQVQQPVPLKTVDNLNHRA